INMANSQSASSGFGYHDNVNNDDDAFYPTPDYDSDSRAVLPGPSFPFPKRSSGSDSSELPVSRPARPRCGSQQWEMLRELKFVVGPQQQQQQSTSAELSKVLRERQRRLSDAARTTMSTGAESGPEFLAKYREIRAKAQAKETVAGAGEEGSSVVADSVAPVSKLIQRYQSSS
ncbi:hypothetical protein BOX15_Mlig021179g1, partial [Macrostomum lignano]